MDWSPSGDDWASHFSSNSKYQLGHRRGRMTPRLPRGVSRIPRQVHGHDSNSGDPNQQQEDSIETCNSNSSRYLTFNKDQAASHFKSLKAEFGGQKREVEQAQEQGQGATSPPTRLRPWERLPASRARATDNDNEGANLFSSACAIRQQPVCEAFIMTGQSMLKLSCNGSENNATSGQTRQAEPRIKSLSLNKLDSNSSSINNNNNNNNNGGANQQSSNEQIVQRRYQEQTGGAGAAAATNRAQNCELPPRTPTSASRSGRTVESSNDFDTSKPNEMQTGLLEAATAELDSISAKRVAAERNGVRSSDAIGFTHQTATTVLTATTTATTTTTASVATTKTEPDTRPKRIETNADSRPTGGEQRADPMELQRNESKIESTEPPQNDWHKELKLARGEQEIKTCNLNAEKQTLPLSADNSQQARHTAEVKTDSGGGVAEMGDEAKQRQARRESAGDATPSPPTTPARNDRDSARRLAKRLYNLSGFKRPDVCHHLAKSNPFSQMVAEEYLNLFDFRAMKLDGALRKFLSKLQLNGETQEREWLLSRFSQRYYECNKDKFPTADTVQTLVCALILLNTDLHGGHIKKKKSKLSLGAFVDGLNNSLTALPACSSGVASLDVGSSGCVLNGGPHAIGYTFPRHLLIDLYESIKKRPLKCSDDKCDMTSFEAELDKIYGQQGGNRSNTLPTRRFAPGSNAPSSTMSASARRQMKQGLGKLNGQDDAEAAIQFKSGYLNRKRVFEAHGRPTGKGRRGWRRVYVTLNDLRMIMRPNHDDSSKQAQLTAKQISKTRAQTMAQDMKNTIKVHHTFAKRSTSYTKREFVFHLRLADQSEFLLQTSSEQDLDAWVDTINFASACLSTPALPGAVSNSRQQHQQTQRPLLPVSYTSLSYWEQLINHEERLQRLKVELDEHLSEASNTKNANKRFKTEFIEKIAYLKQEIERYTVYVDLMRKKSNSPEAIILSKHPQIASLTPSKEMILSLPSFAPPDSVASADALAT